MSEVEEGSKRIEKASFAEVNKDFTSLFERLPKGALHPAVDDIGRQTL